MLNISTIIDHWFWIGIVAAVIVWYSTITIYVTIRGAFDIKHMFARLSNQSAAPSSDAPSDENPEPLNKR
jgi:hypothetical protein